MPTTRPIIDVETFIDHIRNAITQFDKLINEKSRKKQGEYKRQVTETINLINHYFSNPNLIQKAAYHGGLEKIKEQYAADLFRIKIYLAESKLLTLEQAKKVNEPLSVLAQHIKARRAYTELYKGKKFQVAGLGKFNENRPITQKNPIIIQSKKNIAQLKNELNKRGNIKSKLFGLRDDEIELFESLLNLPFKLQHATNHFYESLNAGSLNSYKESAT